MFNKLRFCADIGFITFLFSHYETVITVIAGLCGILMYLIRCFFFLRDYLKARNKKILTLEEIETFLKEGDKDVKKSTDVPKD